MQASDKFRTDLAAALARARRPDGSLATAELELFIKRNLTMIPAETREDLVASFIDRIRSNRASAESWLGTIGSIFFKEYDDNSPLDHGDWTALKEAVNLGAGEMDIDLLEYIMGIVLDHRAL